MQIKTATTIDEQIAKLEKRGMTIGDKVKATEILSDIGYYRLGFYWFPFELNYPNKHHRDHRFIEGATFENAVALYNFDHNLRCILSQYLHHIEVHLRTTLIYIVSNHYKYNPTWFADQKIIQPSFIAKLPGLYEDIRKNDAIKHHHKKYHNDIYAPAWKTIEYMTFGSVLYLIENIKDKNLQERIAIKMGIKNLNVFYSHMQTLRILRNICAHGHNLFDLHLPKPIKPGQINNMTSNDRSSISGAIMVISNTLHNITPNLANNLVEDLNNLLNHTKTTPIYAVISHIKKL